MVANGERIRIRGIVQGVGFRPTVWRIANGLSVCGCVRNDGQGVVIDAWADGELIEQLLQKLAEQLPPLAKIDAIERTPLQGGPASRGFEIVDSVAGQVDTAIVADAATCSHCLADVFDPGNRRYRYAFTNCTHCGPRFSIVKAIPYDRANTSMAAFAMCLACQAEYDDPADRRFHAQPNACPQCGPRLWLQDNQGNLILCDDVIDHAASLLAAGQIVAIKGIGGFHLACDAMNDDAVHRLRQRKQRYDKPFALLARDVDMVRRFAAVNEQDKALLQSSAAPIVLLLAGGEAVAEGVAPRQPTLGFALPATALHHLLMRALDNPVVLTSGNVSDEPQCIANDEACEKLAEIADAFLLHDRAIINRVDDSVVSTVGGDVAMVRRARGYAPAALRLPPGFEKAPPALAMGAELKSTFCISQCGQAMLSQHIGDLENAPVFVDYRRQLDLYQSLYQHRPALIAVDKHPNYLSTQYGRQLAERQGIDCIEIQHHHAHIAAVMAEHGMPLDSKPVLGIALDGLGLGEHGELWGGEFLLADYGQFQRLASFEPVPLLGGSHAMREPWRNTLAQLLHWFDWQTLTDEFAQVDIVRYLQQKPVVTLQQMAERGINSPLCSSAGRLFDAVAAAIGVCRDQVSYEGQAAIELEALAQSAITQERAYPIESRWVDGRWVLGGCALWQALLLDIERGESTPVIAARFHRAMIDSIAAMAVKLCRKRFIEQVVLAGGVFQNGVLLEDVKQRLVNEGFQVMTPCQLPFNDGAIALGQLAVVLASAD